PLIRLKELSIFNLDYNKFIKIKSKKLNKIYKDLSKNMILGRAVNLCTGYGSYIIYFEDLRDVEDFINRYFIAADVFEYNSEAFVIAYCAKTNNINNIINKYYNIKYYDKILSIVNYGVPFKYYDPINGWSFTKQNIINIFNKYNLI
ncbi:MAG: hypothetical protein GSR85_05635, partial [Desulfurococcales archaeon]|nr:hypothetical protein [Desulfurococcales archaeon]